MIVVKLRAAMDSYRHRTNRRITYAELADKAEISAQTLSSIPSRRGYKPGLDTIEKICRALDTPLHDLLELIDDPPKPKRKAKKTRARGTRRE